MTGEGSGHTAWKPTAPSGDLPVADSLAGYTDLTEIGVGGDSVVYRAKEETLGRDVAIKVLNVADDVRAARFAREVEITLDLGRQHPNIVTVLATGIMGSGQPAIVMEFYPGGTLHDRLKKFGPLPVEEVVRIGLVLADALSFAHDRGVLHRDVKPQNVLVLPTSWVLADFGIARLADSEHTGSVETFTYRHASPQVLDGHGPTAADDVWSLGSTLYTLVDGRPPFASHDPDDDSRRSRASAALARRSRGWRAAGDSRRCRSTTARREQGRRTTRGNAEAGQVRGRSRSRRGLRPPRVGCARPGSGSRSRRQRRWRGPRRRHGRSGVRA